MSTLTPDPGEWLVAWVEKLLSVESGFFFFFFFSLPTLMDISVLIVISSPVATVQTLVGTCSLLAGPYLAAHCVSSGPISAKELYRHTGMSWGGGLP